MFDVEVWREYRAALDAAEGVEIANGLRDVLREHGTDGEAEDILRIIEQRAGTDPKAHERKARRLMNKLVADNMPLVKKFTKRTMGSRSSNDASFEEACNEGAMGLVKAIEKYDEHRGAFSTFAQFQIRHAVQTCMARQGDFVKTRPRCMPASVAKDAARFRAKYGREPERHELTWNGADIPQRTWDTWHEQAYVDFVETTAEENEDVFADERSGAEEEIDAMALRDRVTELLVKMSPRNRDLTKALFIDGRSLEDVADEMGLCKQRVHQIKLELGQRIRKALSR
jgi:RNA polymerase sigma factor (sigma-70 family)